MSRAKYLLTIVETAPVVKSLSQKSGKSVEEVEKIWKSIKNHLFNPNFVLFN